MTIHNSVNAYPVLLKLKSVPFPFSDLLALRELIKQVSEEAMFFAEQERALALEYADNGEIKDGHFEISDAIKRTRYMERKKELMETKCRITDKRLTLKLSDKGCQLSLAEIEAIEPFIDLT